MKSQGQESGAVEYKHLGVRFVIPDGWTGREVSAGYLIGSPAEQGFALVRTSRARTIGQLESLASQGIYDENGTNLTLSGALERVTGNGIGGEFEGLFEGTPAKAYIAGLINPRGSGVLILSAAAAGNYSTVHKKLALDLAESMHFFTAEVPPAVLEWQTKLRNARLTYMDSYYSNDAGVDVGGTVFSSGGGFSAKEEIHLSEQGYFRYNKSGSSTIDAGGVYGSTAGGGQENGTWEVAPDAHGEPVLHLRFNNGDERAYSLEYQDNKTLLNGVRYFLTYG